jgi:hypothetical protein
MALAAVTLAAASTVHFGAALGPIRDPFPDAATPEAVIAVIMACGLVATLVRGRAAWPIALATTLVAVVGVCYGLSVTLGGPRTGDVVYHLSLLAVLLATLGLLVMPPGRAALRAR